MRDDAVTPVVGTVMVLAITMLGIAAVMFWGAPTLQSIEDRNTVLAMEGELLELRAGTLALMIDKSSRNPEINLPEGSIDIGPGTRMMIAHEGAGTSGACDLVITDWDAGATSFTIAGQAAGCPLADPPSDCEDGPPGAGAHCVRLQAVTGNNLDGHDVTITGGGPYTVNLASGDITGGDWNIRIEDASEAAVAEAWLLETKRITWRHSSSVGSSALHLEGGALFEERDGRTFVIKPPAVQEDAFGTADLFLRIPTYTGDEGGASQGASPHIFIGQVGNNHLRMSVADTTGVRFSFSGDLGSAWCQTLLQRTSGLTGAAYVEPTPDACDAALPTVLYEPTTQTNAIPFELIHARITTRITV